MKTTLHQVFSNAYGRLGRTIARRPLCFLLVPVIFASIMPLGIFNISYRRDLFNLFTPSNGRTIRDLNIMEKFFEANISTEYDISRLIKERMYVTVIISALDGKTIIRKEIFEEIRLIDRIVQNVTVNYKGNILNYEKICATNFGKCSANTGLLTDKQIDAFHTGDFTMKYPVEIDPVTYKVTPYATNFGGVTTDEDGYIEEVLAYRYFYSPDAGRVEMRDAMAEWEQNVMKRLRKERLFHTKLTMTASSNKERHSSQFTENVLHLSGISAITIILFCMLVCMTSSWVKSKPWLGLSACISTSLASISAFGLVMLCGVSYIDMNVALPFLMLGMGIDDSFVLLSAWRRTDPSESVEHRLERTYSDTATSITITSLTNFVSFSVGLTAPFPVVRIFCAYAATGVIFTLLFQLTFYGACLALTGQREAKGLHPFTFRKIKDAVKCDEGSDAKVRSKAPSARGKAMETFGAFMGRILARWPVKVTVIVLYCFGVILGGWRFHHIKEGLDLRQVLPSTSPSIDLLNDYYKYFTRYAHRIHVAVTSPLNYADPQTEIIIERTLKKFEANPLIADATLTESWLRAFRMFASSEVSQFSLGAYNLSHKQDFIDGLRVFLRFPQTRNFRKDVVFNENFTEIVASRFFLLCNEVNDKEEEKSLLETIWRITDKSEIPITAFSYWFTFYEQLTLIKPAAITTLAIATAAIMIIFFMFIPDITCSLVVSLLILTIEIEVIGVMALWNVSLDIFSLMNLIMCVGFSINYPAHLAFAYMTSDAKTSEERSKAALYAIGFPIIQGSLSTLLGISVLVLDPSYMFTVFVKITFLVVVLTAVHTILVLPVALSVADRFLCFVSRKENKDVYYSLSTMPE